MRTLFKRMSIVFALFLIPLLLSFASAGSNKITSISGDITTTLEYDISPDIVSKGNPVDYRLRGCITDNTEAFTGKLYISGYNTSRFSFHTNTFSNSGIPISNSIVNNGGVEIDSSNFPVGGGCFEFRIRGEVNSSNFNTLIPRNFGVSFYTGNNSEKYDVVLYETGNFVYNGTNQSTVENGTTLKLRPDLYIKDSKITNPYDNTDVVTYKTTIGNSGGDSKGNFVLYRDSNFEGFDQKIKGVTPIVSYNTIVWQNLQINSETKITLTGKLINNRMQGTPFIFRGEVQNSLDSDTKNNREQIRGTVRGRAHLSLEKSVINNNINQGPYYSGDEVTFRFTIINTGTRDATGIRLTDNISQLSNKTINNITVPAGGITGFNLTFTVKGKHLGEFTNRARISDSTSNTGTIIEKNIGSALFHIRPKTELTVTKTYCGMNGNCNNPIHPYGKRYDGYQKVGYKITVHNSGNIQASGLTLVDNLPSGYFSGFSISNNGTFDNKYQGKRTNITINKNGTRSFYITGQLERETPKCTISNSVRFQGSNYNETNSDSDHDGVLETSIKYSDTNTDACIQGMSHISITKKTTGPGQCRKDPRIANNSHPDVNGLGFPKGCLPGPAMPGDTVGFDITIRNNGTRLATGLRLQDIFPNGFTYPTSNGSSVLNFVSGSIKGNIYGTAPTINLSTNNIGITTGGTVTIHITGSLVNLTGYDVNQIKENIGRVSDPLLQSGVVVGTNGTDTATSEFEISEYMQGFVEKTIVEGQNGVLSGDTVAYKGVVRNIGNTGFYLQVKDERPDSDLAKPGDTDANLVVNTGASTQFMSFIPNDCFSGVCNPINQNYKRVDNNLMRYSPVKYFPVNTFGQININTKVISSDNPIINTLEMQFADNSNLSHKETVSSRADISQRGQLEFHKRVFTNGPTNAGDELGFEIEIVNTGHTDWHGDLTVKDKFPECMNLISSNPNVDDNRTQGHDLVWLLKNITIKPKKSYTIKFNGQIGDPYQCSYSGKNANFENQACMQTGDINFNWHFDLSDNRCDHAIGKLAQDKFSIEKTILTGKYTKFPDDKVVFKYIITNNSPEDGKLYNFEDERPRSIVEFDEISMDGTILSPSWNGNTMRINGNNIGTIGGNQSVVLIATGHIPSSSIPNQLGNIYTNTGRVRFNTNGVDIAESVATGKLLTGIYVKKEILSDPYVVSGSLIDFRLSFLNYSGNPISYYHIQDVFPQEPQEADGLFYVNGNPIPYNINDLNNGDLNPERSGFDIPSQLNPIFIDLQAQVYSDANGFNSIINEGKFDFFDAQDGNLLYSDTATAILYPSADLQIIKELTSDIPQKTGDPVNYKITLKNIGSKRANNIELKDIRPENFLPQNNLGNINFSPRYTREEGGNYIRDISSLNPGGEYIINISTTLTNYTQGGKFCNTAFAKMSGEYNGNGAGLNTGEICTLMAGTPDLRTKKTFVGNTGDRPKISGDTVSYKIEFGNSGNRETLDGWKLTDTFNENFLVYDHFDSDTNGVSNLTLVSSGDGELEFTGTNISEHSNTGQITVHFKLKDNFQSYLLNNNNIKNNCWTNNSTVKLGNSMLTDTYTSNDSSDSERVCVLGMPDLRIKKEITQGKTGSSAGTPVVYEITYGNSGTAISSGWSISDILPEELTGYTFEPMPSIVGNQATWTGNDLKPGDIETITITGNIKKLLIADGTNVFCNTGVVNIGNGQFDMILSNNEDGDCVIPGGGFTTYKKPETQYGISGGLVKFEFGFENNTDKTICIYMGDNLKENGFEFYSGSTEGLDISNSDGVVYKRENIGPLVTGKVEITAVVTPNSYDFGKLTNIAKFTVYENGDCSGNPLEYTEKADVLPIADVIVDKKVTSPRNPRVNGDEINYTVTLKNIGGVQATGIELCDTKPEQVGDLETDDLGIIAGCSYGLKNKTLNPGQTLDIKITSKLSGDYPVGTEICNNAKVYPRNNRYTGEYDMSRFDNRTGLHIDKACVTVEGVPDLWTKKTFVGTTGDRPVLSGDVVNYKIEFGNSGDRNVSGLVVSGTEITFTGRTIEDKVPSFLTYSGILETSYNGIELVGPTEKTSDLVFLGSGVLLSGGQNGGSITLQFVLNKNYDSYKVNPDNCRTNTGNINMPFGLEDRETNKDNNISGSESVCVIGKPDLWIKKEILTGTFPKMKRDKVIYQITYGNSGNAEMTGWQIYDKIPEYLTGLQFSSEGNVDSSNPYEIVRTGKHLGISDSMPINYFGTITITGELAENFEEKLRFCNTGFIQNNLGAELIDLNTGNNISGDCSVVGGAADLGVIKTYEGAVAKSGDTMRFTLEYYNTGTKTATGPIIVKDFLPPVFDYVKTNSLTHMGKTLEKDKDYKFGQEGKTITWTIDTGLVYHTSGIVDFEVVLNQDLSGGMEIINTGHIVASDPEPDYNNNYDVVRLRASHMPEIAIDKQIIQNGSGKAGDNVVFALNFINNGILGSGDATGVWITDVLPTGFDFDVSDCEVQLATVTTIPGIGTTREYSPWPGSPDCVIKTSDSHFLQVTGLVVSGQVEGRVLLTGTLNFQPTTEFCYTNTGKIYNGYQSGKDFVSIDYYDGNNISVVTGCMEPQYGISVNKTAYPEREGIIDSSVGVDISGATIGFDIEVVNNGEIAVTGTSLYDIFQTSGLPKGFFNILSGDNILPEKYNLLLTGDIVLQPGESVIRHLTGILTTRAWGSFYNSGVFTYQLGDEEVSVTGGTLIEEPDVCGDYILSRQEQCEALSDGLYLASNPEYIDASGHLLPGLVCNNKCEIEMKYFENVAVMCDEEIDVCLTGVVTGYIADKFPVLSIEKTAIGGTHKPGDEVWFNIKITNTGTKDAENLVFTDTRPTSLDITKVEPKGKINLNSDDLYTNLGTLEIGHSVEFKIYGTIKEGTEDDIKNTAYAQADETKKVFDSATILVEKPVIPDSGVSITKKAITEETLYIGDEAKFEVVITNVGEKDAKVKLTDLWPSSQLEFGGRTVDTDGIDGNLQDGWDIPNLPARTGKIVFTFTGKVIVDRPESATNKATIIGQYLPNGDKINLSDRDSVVIGKKQDGGCKEIGPDRDVQVRLSDGVDKVVVPFTCEADDDASESSYIEIFCDNGEDKVDGNGKTLSTKCEYTKEGNYNPYCKVNGHTQGVCKANVDVNEDSFDVCGDGIIQGTEQCDLYGNDKEKIRINEEGQLEDRDSNNEFDDRYASDGNNTYYCNGCSIDRDEKPVVVPPTCMYTDVPISIQQGEKLPFWRNVDMTNSVDNEGDCNGNEGKIIKDSMQCTFKIYRKEFEAIKESYGTIKGDCNLRNMDELGELKTPLENMFSGYTNSINGAIGNYVLDTSDNGWENNDIYGEYKISLDKVKYKYCDEDGTVSESTRKRVCQSNFALTKPYLIQRGATTTLTDTNLADFYAMNGKTIIENIELDKIKTTQLSHYDGGSSLENSVNMLFEKFDNDKVTIKKDNTDLNMRIVKGKKIFIVGKGSDDLITYEEKDITTTPITVLVTGNLVIKGDIKTPTMFVVGGEVAFKNSDCNKDQTVNGIVIAKKGFIGDEDQKNTSLDKRCMKGGLHIQGVLVGQNINNIVSTKRSHLNKRFELDDTSKTINEERREEIYDGASVLIEHNPDLRLNLPPGASYIQDSLKTWR